MALKKHCSTTGLLRNRQTLEKKRPVVPPPIFWLSSIQSTLFWSRDPSLPDRSLACDHIEQSLAKHDSSGHTYTREDACVG